jgi:hypothetical protein
MQDKITLTEDEQALFDTLLAAAEFAGSKTVLRAAGGWVRDKLLGKESADIDIALDNMLGKSFADKVCHHQSFPGPLPQPLSAIISQQEPMTLFKQPLHYAVRWIAVLMTEGWAWIVGGQQPVAVAMVHTRLVNMAAAVPGHA